MGLFGSILEKLGLQRRDEPPPLAPRTASTGPANPPPSTPPSVHPPMAIPGGPIREVDVVSRLEGLAAANPQKLNWKTSIVDLLKLLGLESSLAARKELAAELGCPPEKMGDSAQMNVWLHKTVLRKLAENGGNVPKELLD